MSSDPAKSREEILAERKAKKKNKGAKNQPKTESQESKKPEKPVDLSTENQQLGIQNKENKRAAEEKSQGDVKENQKSREEVLAEREAKRLTKQSGRKKDQVSVAQKDENAEIKSAENVPDAKGTKASENDNVKTETISDGKSKAQLRAERRAKQDAQRAKKLDQKTSVEAKVEILPSKTPQVAVKTVKPPSQIVISHRVKLFAHLYHDLPDSDDKDLNMKVHPSILRLGTQYRSGIISGANVRCLALLNALRTVINDFETPLNQEFSRGLEAEITKSTCYLNKCRPVAVSMVNAVKHLKYQVSHVKGTEMDSKSQLKEWIDTYIKEQLETAGLAICMFVREKITNNDVILTYGCSSLIERLLISAHKEKVKFRVIVVDGRPWLEGREMLRKLVAVGIHCTYIFVNGLSFIMPEVTKVLLGAHALLANGYVMSRAGSSEIALMAKAYNVPVLICCETHKFSERVQTDAFVYNELGDPNDLVSNKGCLSTGLSGWKNIPHLTPLNLKYDVTPPDLVSAVVTEIAVLPCTSVPVILRIKPTEVPC